MFRKNYVYVLLGILVLQGGFWGCADEVGFFWPPTTFNNQGPSPAFNPGPQVDQTDAFANLFFVDVNGLAVNNGTAFIPTSGIPFVTADAGQSLAFTDGDLTCEDPLESFSTAGCLDTTGLVDLTCPSEGNHPVKVQLNGEIVHTFTLECLGQTETVTIPGLFLQPRGYFPSLVAVAGYSTVSNEIMALIPNLVDGTTMGELENTLLIDVAIDAKGIAYVTGVNDVFNFQMALSGQPPLFLGDPQELVPGTILVIDTRTNVITDRIEVSDFFPLNIATSPLGDKAYVTGLLIDSIINTMEGPDSPPEFGTVGVIDTTTLEISTPMNLDALPIHVAFSEDGQKAVAGVVFADENCDEVETRTGCRARFDGIDGGAILIDVANDVIVDSFPFPGFIPGEIAVNQNKAYFAIPKLLGLLGIISPRTGFSCPPVMPVLNLSLDNTVDWVSLEGVGPDGENLCPLSLSSSPSANEIYVGALANFIDLSQALRPNFPFPGVIAFLAVVDTSTNMVSHVLDMNPYTLPLALATPASGDKVYISFGQVEVPVDNGGPTVQLDETEVINALLVYDPGENQLSEEFVPLNLEGIFVPGFNLAIQGGK